MEQTEFFKVYGAQERQDQLIKLSANNYLLIFGFGRDSEESESGYTLRKYYDHKPSKSELKSDIDALINKQTELLILDGFVWNGKRVYLSDENQHNFKAAYDLAKDSGGATLPTKFKLGEDEEGEPIYHTFTKIEPFADFIYKAFGYINTTLNEGWVEKDGVDYSKLLDVE